MTGLWHLAARLPCTGTAGSGLYYGVDAQCDYDAGFSAGSATSPAIPLPPGGPITLTFDYNLETELGFCTWDLVTVAVSTDGFSTSTLLAAQPGCGAPVALSDPSPGWTGASVDLTAFAGSTVQLRFSFTTVDGSFNTFLGWFIDNVEIDAPCAATLSLEGVSCQNDVHPDPGHQIAVELWMGNLCGPQTGFFASLDYEIAKLDFRPDLSSYNLAGFGPGTLVLIPMGAAEGPAGNLILASNAALGGGGLATDSLLCTLVFDVLNECAFSEVEFDLLSFFPSELSYLGIATPTTLLDTGLLALDDTDPLITCPGDQTQPADVELSLCGTTDCCTNHGGLGCSEPGCTAIVCGVDPFCCGSSWDSICAGEALSLCPPSYVAPCVGAVVTYPAPIVSDNCGVASVVCTPPSGAFFPIGTTTVTCTVTDTCGNTASCDFDITVTPTNLIDVDVVLVGSNPVLRCIHFVTDDCSVTADEVLSFSGPIGGPALAFDTIEVECGDWSQLCAKDAQHTKWDTKGLVPAGDRWVVAAPLVLLPGDTDNDGDVDINDVTWIVFTFGGFALPGGCPFVTNTPRDGDFSNEGAIGSEDYSLLSGEFLTVSSCACASPATAPWQVGFEGRLALPVSAMPLAVRSADLTRDGLFDWRDVAEFERRHGLPEGLSRTMREHR